LYASAILSCRWACSRLMHGLKGTEDHPDRVCRQRRELPPSTTRASAHLPGAPSWRHGFFGPFSIPFPRSVYGLRYARPRSQER
jgi:hypothetical protein